MAQNKELILDLNISRSRKFRMVGTKPVNSLELNKGIRNSLILGVFPPQSKPPQIDPLLKEMINERGYKI